jgi:Tubulin-tyrosine ligase family
MHVDHIWHALRRVGFAQVYARGMSAPRSLLHLPAAGSPGMQWAIVLGLPKTLQRDSWRRHCDLLKTSRCAVEDKQRRIVCRLPQNREICTKARLARHMTRLQVKYGRNVPFVPETYTLSAKLHIGQEVARLKEAAARSAANGDGNVWIVKPESRNRGIVLPNQLHGCAPQCIFWCARRQMQRLTVVQVSLPIFSLSWASTGQGAFRVPTEMTQMPRTKGNRVLRRQRSGEHQQHWQCWHHLGGTEILRESTPGARPEV